MRQPVTVFSQEKACDPAYAALFTGVWRARTSWLVRNPMTTGRDDRKGKLHLRAKIAAHSGTTNETRVTKLITCTTDCPTYPNCRGEKNRGRSESSQQTAVATWLFSRVLTALDRTLPYGPNNVKVLYSWNNPSSDMVQTHTDTGCKSVDPSDWRAPCPICRHLSLPHSLQCLLDIAVPSAQYFYFSEEAITLHRVPCAYAPKRNWCDQLTRGQKHFQWGLPFHCSIPVVEDRACRGTVKAR